MKKLIAPLIIALSASAHAQFYSGNELFERLNDPERQFFALGFIAGVSDSNVGVWHCPPERVTLGQTRDVVHRELKANPDERHLSAAVLVGAYLQRTWPCKAKTPTAFG